MQIKNLIIPCEAKLLCDLLYRYGYEGRLVGGYVRDILKGLTPHEIDMATNARPDAVIDICQSNDIRAIPTGISHGTVTVVVNGKQVEITTLRRDVNCYGRHADVAFTDDWQEDAKRRDFTINAMSLDRNLKLYDFFHGQEDLHNNIVRFIGDPKERIREDYLRIMRYFRFLGYLEELQLDNDSFYGAVSLSDNLNKISPERIRSELLKILSCRAPHIPIRLMLNEEVFQRIGLGFNSKIHIEKLYFSSDSLINLALIMKLSNISNVDILRKLKFSNAEQKLVGELLKCKLDNHFEVTLQNMVKGIDATSDIHNKMQEVGKDIYLKLFEMHFCNEIKSLASCNYSETLSSFKLIINSIKLKDFPLSGKDILDLGYSGKDIGIELRLARNLWINSNCTLDKQSLIKLLQS